MTGRVLQWVLNCFALFFVMKLLPGIQIDQFTALLAGTLVITLLNVFVRPLLILLTLPVTILTMGFFTLLINGFVFYLAAHLVSGFRVDSFGTACVAALLYSLFSCILNLFFKRDAA